MPLPEMSYLGQTVSVCAQGPPKKCGRAGARCRNSNYAVFSAENSMWAYGLLTAFNRLSCLSKDAGGTKDMCCVPIKVKKNVTNQATVSH